MSEGLVKVRLIQQGSGPGSYPIGTILEVTPEEARGLCGHGDSHSTPFAVLVTEDRTETADAPEKRNVETRKADPAPAKAAPPPPEPPKAEEPVKRGPGRPPGSTSRPRPQ